MNLCRLVCSWIASQLGATKGGGSLRSRISDAVVDFIDYRATESDRQFLSEVSVLRPRDFYFFGPLVPLWGDTLAPEARLVVPPGTPSGVLKMGMRTDETEASEKLGMKLTFMRVGVT